MPRKPRLTFGNQVYHVLNRAAGKRILFRTPSDYSAFEQVLREACARTGMRVLAYCLMPNHCHFLLWPMENGDLQRFMQWLTATHARRWNTARGRVGHGAVYQSRFKSIPVSSDTHLLVVWRYVERNALRANLVKAAEEWQWGSKGRSRARCGGTTLWIWFVAGAAEARSPSCLRYIPIKGSDPFTPSPLAIPLRTPRPWAE
jgi:putative transposase